ncbi:MAG TPA: hypothetical protein VHU80_15670 [Polyangiaceae bacterium]|jgi:hypothetical protein|nr:hypothetical protein [Polyangiaceae bacterium]
MTTKQGSQTALAIRESSSEPWRDVDWQKLWLLLKARPWTSIAMIPAGEGAPPDFTLTIAATLARIGVLHLGTPIHVADATNIPLARLEQFQDEIDRLNREGDLVLVALPTVDQSPITVALARKASFSVLCIMLEVMGSADAKRTVERVGRNAFLGSAVFHPYGRTGTELARTKNDAKASR